MARQADCKLFDGVFALSACVYEQPSIIAQFIQEAPAPELQFLVFPTKEISFFVPRDLNVSTITGSPIAG